MSQLTVLGEIEKVLKEYTGLSTSHLRLAIFCDPAIEGVYAAQVEAKAKGFPKQFLLTKRPRTSYQLNSDLDNWEIEEVVFTTWPPTCRSSLR